MISETKVLRKLFIYQGELGDINLSSLLDNYPGDWLFITPHKELNLFYPPQFSSLLKKNCFLDSKTKLLLGNSYRHAIFDATTTFNLDALSILAGTLSKGSLLILLLPISFDGWLDNDSLRWVEGNNPIHPTNFIHHLLTSINRLAIPHFDLNSHKNLDENVNRENLDNSLKLNLTEQQNRLVELLQSEKEILTIIAKRGRGKSSLAGLFTHHKKAIVTAPNRGALSSFFQYASPLTTFYAPDELLLTKITDKPDFLIIDEAAMLPLPLLEKLFLFADKLPCRLLLTTTVEGYEGTGQGILLKLLKNRKVDYFYLEEPLRWYDNDPIENFIDSLLLNNSLIEKREETQFTLQQKMDSRTIVDRNQLAELTPIYHLLKRSHYRTTLTDLRRLFDAPNLMIAKATLNDNLLGAVVTLSEGGLEDGLIQQVWQGIRRPKGNLVAQSLVAHAGEKLAAKLKSLRINRIAVDSPYRRKGIAKDLIHFIENSAESYHFLSVSFAYDKAVYSFWQACGFRLVHVASHKEASSGTYSVMALKAVSLQGHQLIEKLENKLQRNWFWLSSLINLDLDLTPIDDQRFTVQDYEDILGFTDYHRPFEATFPALCRLILYCNLTESGTDKINYPLLLNLIKERHGQFNVENGGKRAAMKILKQEVVKIVDEYKLHDIL